MNAKQLVEFAADLRLDVPGAKLALLVAVEGFESAEITRLSAEVDALKRTHDEAMKRSHEVTQEMARQFETEVEALRADAALKRDLLLWALYHAQGGSSRVGQAIRRHLGIEQHARLTPEQIKDAERAAQGERG